MDTLNREQFNEMLANAVFIGVCGCLVKYHSHSFCTVQTWNQGHFVENRQILPRNDFPKCKFGPIRTAHSRDCATTCQSVPMLADTTDGHSYSHARSKLDVRRLNQNPYDSPTTVDATLTARRSRRPYFIASSVVLVAFVALAAFVCWYRDANIDGGEI